MSERPIKGDPSLWPLLWWVGVANAEVKSFEAGLRAENSRDEVEGSALIL